MVFLSNRLFFKSYFFQAYSTGVNIFRPNYKATTMMFIRVICIFRQQLIIFYIMVINSLVGLY